MQHWSRRAESRRIHSIERSWRIELRQQSIYFLLFSTHVVIGKGSERGQRRGRVVRRLSAGDGSLWLRMKR